MGKFLHTLLNRNIQLWCILLWHSFASLQMAAHHADQESSTEVAAFLLLAWQHQNNIVYCFVPFLFCLFAFVELQVVFMAFLGNFLPWWDPDWINLRKVAGSFHPYDGTMWLRDVVSSGWLRQISITSPFKKWLCFFLEECLDVRDIPAIRLGYLQIHGETNPPQNAQLDTRWETRLKQLPGVLSNRQMSHQP